ncbi:MAG: type I restriction enzyme HsdR N-terminal domain-containing protein [Alphaproteobacteria bacterium]
MAIPKRAIERVTAGLKKYQAVLTDAKNRDINERDTVIIIVDMVADLLGYKKFTEITTEFPDHAGGYIDLAVKVDKEIRFLIEAKAINVELKDSHVRQGVSYGATLGTEWVILTNGVHWRIYKIHFGQPIEQTLVRELDLLAVTPRDDKLLECFGSISREGFTKSSMTAFFQQQQAMGKFSVAALLLSEPVIGAARRELHRLYPSVKVEPEVLRSVIENDVFKREVVDGDEARLAQGAIKKAAKAVAKAKATAESEPVPSIKPDAT